jgi:hypothetical protein
MKPSKGKAKVKVLKSGRRVSYGQAGKASDGGPKEGTYQAAEKDGCEEGRTHA